MGQDKTCGLDIGAPCGGNSQLCASGICGAYSITGRCTNNQASCNECSPSLPHGARCFVTDQCPAGDQCVLGPPSCQASEKK